MPDLLVAILVLLLRLLYRTIDVVSDLVFPLYWGKATPLPPMRSPLLKMSASSLAKKIAEGEVTSHLVVSTFIQRIKEVNPIINAMVDARFFEALAEAKAIDQELDGLDPDKRRERCL